MESDDKKLNNDNSLETDSILEDLQAPADALSRTPSELKDSTAESGDKEKTPSQPKKPKDKQKGQKFNAIRQLARRFNIYFLLFVLVVIIAAIITTVVYLNNKKVTTEMDMASQQLTEEALQQLAHTDASVGDSSQTLTIQGNAIIEGQTLMRGNLNVAGSLQTGGSIQGPSLTISGSSNLSEAQINNLQVAGNTAVQGSTTLRNLAVSGSSSFSGPITADSLTVTTLVLSGNASLQIPNHISFAGPSPQRSINSGSLGSGGSASVNGSDTAGTININTGNNPAPGCFVSISFNQRFSNQPHVIISPIGPGAANTKYYVTKDQSGFSVCATNSAPANQAFSFDYFVTN